MNEHAKSALAAWREDNPDYKRENLNPIERAKRNPKSKALDIKAMCWDCSGRSKQEVILCQVKKCPLYDHRPYVKKGTSEDEDENTDE